MFYSSFFFLSLFLFLSTFFFFQTQVAGQWEDITINVYADPFCKVAVYSNLSFPTFNPNGSCTNVGPASEIGRCSADGASGFLVLDTRFWSTSTNCPNSVMPDYAFYSRSKSNMCGQFQISVGNNSQTLYGTFLCNANSSIPNLSDKEIAARMPSYLDITTKFIQREIQRIGIVPPPLPSVETHQPHIVRPPPMPKKDGIASLLSRENQEK